MRNNRKYILAGGRSQSILLEQVTEIATKLLKGETIYYHGVKNKQRIKTMLANMINSEIYFTPKHESGQIIGYKISL